LNIFPSNAIRIYNSIKCAESEEEKSEIGPKGADHGQAIKQIILQTAVLRVEGDFPADPVVPSVGFGIWGVDPPLPKVESAPPRTQKSILRLGQPTNEAQFR